jgi:serine/threonine protein kinase
MDASYDNDLAGTSVSRYTIVDLIGAGGMGRVYRARDERLQRHVAIKVRIRQAGSDPHQDRELMAEARALSRLCHPHIATIHDFLTESERDFIVMEFVPGATLKEMLASGPLPFADVLRLGRQMVQGLVAAHAAQLIHRDIKPANLKVTSAGELKILDFGLAQLKPGAAAKDAARDLSTRSPSAFGPIGTMPYMAPEQLRGERADERSDIFSAGAVLYEMATGQQAFPQANMPLLVDAILHQDPVAPSIVNSRVRPAFDGVVSKSMEKSPGRRYQTAGELEAALACLSAERPRAFKPPLIHWLSSLLG